MGITELRQVRTQHVQSSRLDDSVGEELVKTGKLSKSDVLLAQLVGRHCDTSMDRILTAEGLASENDLLEAHARRLQTRQLNEAEIAQADVLETHIAPQQMLRHGFLPIRDEMGRPTVATSDMEHLRNAAMDLPLHIAGAPRVLAPRQAVQGRIAEHYRAGLTAAAESRVDAQESCRNWAGNFNMRLALTIGVLTALSLLTLAFPTAVFAIFLFWATVTLLVTAGMKTAAFVASLSVDTDAGAFTSSRKKPPLPKVSILVPLFREKEILHALIARLTQLTYPKCLLDVVLVLEEEDELTQETLAEIDLPPWIRPVVVPDGKPRTKPRAMNYALDFCEGDIIGIFDAEDAPDPDQITVVARRFQTAPPEVVCLQGILDYYNPQQNWLARCFTIEYATWFRLMLPGMVRLGFAIPLGGTTLYFKREALEELGGWDAHNVTEDADLGFRLARHGYRTEMVNTVTQEEANCHFWPWIKQRSRWLKGYMTTYLVHMRQPRLLYKQLGPWKFWGFQAHFITALSQFLLAPFLWSFWLILFGLPHPMDTVLPRGVLVAFGSLFLMIEVINITIHLTAVSGPKHKKLMLWAPTMHFYSPLGAIAAYKALYELVFKPFFWDKTAHGLSLGHVQVPRAVVSANAADLSAVQLQSGHKRL